MKQKIKDKIGMLFFGILFIGLSLFLLISNASYYFLGKTVDLNEVLKNGEELPKGKFVSYTCKYPIGHYAEMQTYLNGIIPLPVKSQLYAMIDEYDGKGLIFSAKVNKINKIKEFNSTVNEKTESVTVVGYLDTIVNYEATSYLEQTCCNIDGDIVLTHLVLDSTKTRFSHIVMCTVMFAFGVFLLLICFNENSRILRRIKERLKSIKLTKSSIP